MYEDEVQVLIVGAGPVGLSAGLFLARLGVRVLVVERRAGTSDHPRARGLNYRTMEIFRTIGLEDSIREAGAALADIKLSLLIETLAGKEIRLFGDFEDAESLAKLVQLTPVKWCFCAQDELEPLLLKEAQRYGADIRFGHKLEAFAQDENGLTATITKLDSSETYQAQATYLLAADGANSFIRNELAIGENGRGTIAHYVGIYFKADLQELIKGREFAMAFVKNKVAPGTLSSVNNKDRWVFNVEYYPENNQAASEFTPEHCIELVRTMVGLPDLEVELLSVQPWEAMARIADSYQVGRVFLAGDAVHVMPPAGAFGMNTGIQDVHNLAWKLAAVLNSKANTDLLESYEAERHPVGKATVEQATLRLDFRGGGRPPQPPTTDAAPPKLIDDLTMILGCRYPFPDNTASFSPFPDELNLKAQVGTRAPHVWLQQNGKRISSLDLFDTKFVLLTSPDNAQWQKAAQELAAKQNIEIAVFSVGEGGDLQDLDHKWLAAYDLTPTGAVLVRPDGFVAWRDDSATAITLNLFKSFNSAPKMSNLL